jgi:hypothetical protein
MQVELLADLIFELEPVADAPTLSDSADVASPTTEEGMGSEGESEDSSRPSQKLLAVRAMRKHGRPISAKELGIAIWGSDDKDTTHRASVILSGLKKMGWVQSSGNAQWILTRRAPM